MSRKAFILVVFDSDVHEEYAHGVCQAIEMFEHVITAEPQESTIDLNIAERRVRYELLNKVQKALYGDE